MSYPSTIDSFTNPTPSDDLSTASVLHSSQHSNVNNAINAIETKVGITNSAVTTTLDYRVRTLEGQQFNVKSYGAVGDNSTDDTAAIQTTVNAANSAGGGIVFIPSGTYKISAAIVLPSNAYITGEGRNVSVLRQVTTNVNGFSGLNAVTITIKDMGLTGPNSGSGKGIFLDWNSTNNIAYLSLSNLHVYRFGSHGLDIRTPIVSTFIDVLAEENGGSGFYLHNIATSCSLVSCYGNGNTQAGFYLDQAVYTSLVSCAADSNGIGYLLNNCQGVTLSSCGSESQVVRDATWDGTGFKVQGGSYGNGLYNCWSYLNAAIAIWIKGNSKQITILGGDENTPAGGATAALQVASGSFVTISDFRNTTTNNIATGTTTFLNDGAGNLVVATAAFSPEVFTDYLASDALTYLTIDTIAKFTSATIFPNGGGLSVGTPGSQHKVLEVSDLANAVNYIGVEDSIAGSPTTIYTQGTDANIGLTIATKGTGVTIIDSELDVTGVADVGSLEVSGSSGNLHLTATSDGGEYNISVDATGTLAIFGSTSATLNVNLLDGNLTLTAGKFIKTAPSTPASAVATGTIGQIEWDTGFLYVCTAANTWKRVAIATW